jgi:hypothetical protein
MTPKALASEPTIMRWDKQPACLLFVAVLLCGCNRQKDALLPRSEVFDGVTFEYEAHCSLNAEEKREVLRLAKLRGMTNITTVTAVYALPTLDVRLCVKEPEEIKNREVYYRQLSIAVRTQAGRAPAKANLPVVQRFVARDPQEVKLKIVAVEGKEFRIAVGDEIPVALADEILGKFLRRDIKFHRFVSDLGPDEVKNAQPSYIGTRRGTYVITFFQKGGGSGFEYGFTRDPETGAIEVTQFWVIAI